MGCLFSRRSDGEDTYDMSPIRHLPVIFVNGVPGAGNQTVAQTISGITGYSMIRPGDLVRAESMKDTPRGRLLADRLNTSENVPEQLTIDLIKEAMLADQDATGYILVGFPKTSRLSTMFHKQVKWPEKIVSLEIDKEVAATRLQTKLSELGRPESEINAARQVVKTAARKQKFVLRRFAKNIVTVDSTGNPKALASALKDILTDTMELSQRREHPKPPVSASEPALGQARDPSPPPTVTEVQHVAVEEEIVC